MEHNTTYPVWLCDEFMPECLALLLTDAQSKTLPANALRPYPVRADGDEKKQFTRSQIVSALRSYIDIGVNGGTGTRPDGEVVDIAKYAALSELNAETLSELGLSAVAKISHTHTPSMGANKGKKMTYNTLTQTILRIRRANIARPVRKAKGRKLTVEEKAWMRNNIGPDWWGVGTTDAARKAASLARMDAEFAGSTSTGTEEAGNGPVADTTAQPVEEAEVSATVARVVELRKAFPDMSAAEAKELAELGL